MDHSDFALTFDDLMHAQRKIPILSLGHKKHWRAWLGSTLLHYGLQKWILASPYGPGVTTVYRIHSQQPRLLRVHQDALQTV